jgi:hypothetical protein
MLEAPDDLRFLPETSIESGLSAAGLFFVVMHFTPRFLQHFDHIERSVWEELINKTGYEDLYIH